MKTGSKKSQKMTIIEFDEQGPRSPSPLTTMYSIKKELAFLRPFIRPDSEKKGSWSYIGNRCYTEEEVLQAEKRLGTPLPAPIREVYLQASDLLMRYFYLRPLELLRWDHGYLGFFISPETDTIWGIYKDDDPNALYEWKENDAEDDGYVFEDELENWKKDGDLQELENLLQRHAQYWEKNGGMPLNIQKLDDAQRWNHCLDAYCLFLVLHTICERAEMDALTDDPFPRTYFSTSELYYTQIPPEQKDRICLLFDPLSEYTDLLDFHEEAYGGILMAYISKDREKLLIWDGGWEIMALISLSSLSQAELETIHTALGISFRLQRPQYNGQNPF